MALDITRLSGGNTPADGSDPRTFPAIWNSTATALEGLDLDDLTGVTVTSPTTGQILEYNGSAWVNVEQSATPGDNLLYNGAMQVAQRGTSATGITANGYYTADRWNILVNRGTFTNTVENDGPTGSGFTKSLKMECTTAESPPTGFNGLIYRLEGQDLQGLKKGTADAESLTLSFWVKSNVTGTYIVEFGDQDNSRSISQAYSISSADTWEKKIITIPGDTTGVLDNDNAQSFFLIWGLGQDSAQTSGTLQTSWAATVQADRFVGQTNLAAATSNYWQVTGVQLETGEVATPFEHKPYGVELAECQRYYQRVDVNASGRGLTGTGLAFSTTGATVIFPFNTTMRTAPTALEQSGTAGDYELTGASSITCSAVPTFNTRTTEKIAYVNMTVASGLTSGNAYFGESLDSDAFLAWSAEL